MQNAEPAKSRTGKKQNRQKAEMPTNMNANQNNPTVNKRNAAAVPIGRTGDRRNPCAGKNRRPATVLVMVMAMLAFIFVIGAALLNSVVFENTAVQADKSQREVETVVDAVIRNIEGSIKQGLVGNDGIPFNTGHTLNLGVPDDIQGGNSLRLVDVYSEKVGDSPLIAPIEPHSDTLAVIPAGGAGPINPNPGGPPWIYPYVTHMGTTLAGQRHIPPYNVAIDEPILNQDVDAQSSFDTDGIAGDDVSGNIADADGDGMPDARFEPLGPMLGDSLHRKAADILTPDDTTSPNLVGAFRVIPHGGMVNINESPLTVLDSVLSQCLPGTSAAGITALSDNMTAATGTGVNPANRARYRASLFEPAMRHRFLIGQIRAGQSFDSFASDLLLPGGSSPSLPLGDLFGRRRDGGGTTSVGTWEGGDRWTLIRPEDIFPAGTIDYYGFHVYRDWLNPSAVDATAPAAATDIRGRYDLRHLLTYVGHDDLLSRNGRETNAPITGYGNKESIDQLLFQSGGNLAHYPPTLATHPPLTTPQDPRVGRLLLSLQDVLINPGMLTDSVPTNDYIPISDIVAMYPDRVEMIRETFRLMLSQVNFTGGGTGDYDITTMVSSNPFNAFVGGAMVPQGNLRDVYAAILTANLIDFADADDIPTPIDVRQWMAGPTSGASSMPNYVFGLERQPYISEVYVTFTDGDPDDTSELGVEVCNPYTDVDLDTSSYSLRLVPLSGSTPVYAGAVQIAMPPTIPRSTEPLDITDDTAIELDDGFWSTTVTDIVPLTPTPDVADFWIELVRDVTIPSDGSVAKVIVDRFKWESRPLVSGASESVMRDTRFARSFPGNFALGRWYLPAATPGASGSSAFGVNPFSVTGGNTLGTHNLLTATTPVAVSGGFAPIQMMFANNGELVGPPNVGADATGRSLIRNAFPTTGSLLLLMRFANTTTTPFTEMLDPAGQIDNGRMPVFNQGQKAQPALTVPGEFAIDVPWGQLVFDFFTALPLYNDPDVTGYDAGSGLPAFDPNSPRIDEGGIRVHGRVNINSAPWPVIAGLPMVPQTMLSPPLRQNSIGDLGISLGTLNPATGTWSLGKKRAQAIVAYRDRRLDGSFTFDGTAPTLGYNARSVMGGGMAGLTGGNLRTGLGFETVGELANVVAGTVADFNIHANETDYLRAISRIAALRDWVTVRSHVFTVYGVLSAEGTRVSDYSIDPPFIGVDEKAIRFQETIDRLPCVFGEPLPARIGQRIIGPYLNTPDE
jgi:hypothetical protein